MFVALAAASASRILPYYHRIVEEGCRARSTDALQKMESEPAELLSVTVPATG